mmetsp:Transcript_64559/g.154229  ORF Transcript_64559/g.154229 Transcript_64559/m.154229 type:complete len:1004 (-) Transcript_64559:19-3030(-)
MSTRIIPSLRPFKETILVWDFYNDIVDDTPKNEERRDMLAKIKEEITPLPLNFDNEKQYIEVMRPLFYQELKAQLNRCKQEDMVRIPGSEKPSPTEEVLFQSFKPAMDEPGFISLTVQRETSRSQKVLLSINDMMLLSQNEDPLQETPLHMLAIVEQSFANKVTMRVKLNLDGKDASREKDLAKLIAEKSNWFLTKVTSLATQIREYEALMSLPTMPLRKFIINKEDATGPRTVDMQAAPAMPGMNDDGGVEVDAFTAQAKAAPPVGAEDVTKRFDIPDGLMKHITSKYNLSQQQAILDSAKVGGITLVQGPPGTGKTTTILGILAMLMCSTAKSAKAVSYTRTSGKSAAGNHEDADESDAAEDPETKEAEKLEVRQRMKKNLLKFRSRIPWLAGDYLPWSDHLHQQLAGAGGLSVTKPYPKVLQKDKVRMWSIAQDASPQKLLVCGPSNAAVDEVLRRVTQVGLHDGKDQVTQVAALRLGPNSHKDLKKWGLQDNLQRRVDASAGVKDKNFLENEKTKILKETRIVCSTLSVSGHKDLVGFPEDFDSVIVDEASQAVELSVMVALKLGCRRLILVGDPQQLPATCFSSIAMERNYDQSLFQRLQLSFHKVNMLDMQFRMHPDISQFPSKNFYDGKLLDVLNRADFEAKFPAPWSKHHCFSPLVFYHLDSEMQEEKFSFVNEEEAEFALQLYKALKELYPNKDYKWEENLAIISPYLGQVTKIRAKFNRYFGLEPHSKATPVDINTVDGFQGREKDCIIFSAVRATKKGKEKNPGIGFVRDKRRMNVAFTRARKNLWVIGNAKVLRVNDDWRAFAMIALTKKPSQLISIKGATYKYFEKQLNLPEGFADLARDPLLEPQDGELEIGDTVELDDPDDDGDDDIDDYGKDIEEELPSDKEQEIAPAEAKEAADTAKDSEAGETKQQGAANATPKDSNEQAAAATAPAAAKGQKRPKAAAGGKKPGRKKQKKGNAATQGESQAAEQAAAPAEMDGGAEIDDAFVED